MRNVGSYEAKTHLPKLLKKVEGGKSYTITRHGVPIAELTPPRSAGKRNVSKVVKEIRNFRTGRTLKGLSIRKMVEEGRRF